jgi:hypothetical protein
MPRFYEVAVDIDGRLYAGTWTLRQGGVVVVGCFWGSDVADCGSDRPEIVAARVLDRIVRADQKRQAKETAKFERARARVRGRNHIDV